MILELDQEIRRTTTNLLNLLNQHIVFVFFIKSYILFAILSCNFNDDNEFVVSTFVLTKRYQGCVIFCKLTVDEICNYLKHKAFNPTG